MMRAFGQKGFRAGILFMLASAACVPASAQSPGAPPQLPPGPQPVPGPVPGPFGAIASENYLATSAANEHGSYLWIVAPIQHVIILCEKMESAKDFSCQLKKMP